MLSQGKDETKHPLENSLLLQKVSGVFKSQNITIKNLEPKTLEEFVEKTHNQAVAEAQFEHYQKRRLNALKVAQTYLERKAEGGPMG